MVFHIRKGREEAVEILGGGMAGMTCPNVGKTIYHVKASTLLELVGLVRCFLQAGAR